MGNIDTSTANIARRRISFPAYVARARARIPTRRAVYGQKSERTKRSSDLCAAAAVVVTPLRYVTALIARKYSIYDAKCAAAASRLWPLRDDCHTAWQFYITTTTTTAYLETLLRPTISSALASPFPFSSPESASHANETLRRRTRTGAVLK